MSPRRPQGEGYRILLVEDNDDHAELVRRSLEGRAEGLELVRLSDGQEALAWLEARRGKAGTEAEDPLPGLILLDLRLPKIDGIEVLRSVKTDAGFKDIPVVILSSSGAEEDIVEAYGQQANSYVVKPLDFEKLTLLLRELGSHWFGLGRKPRRG